jgi:drug/metabolite transporter (DMT)-like permease
LDAGVTEERTQATSAVNRPPVGDLVTMGVAVAAISTSGPLIAAIAAPALAIGFWRCALGSGVTLPWALWRHGGELRGLDRAERTWIVIAGLLLAGHFAAWVPSLRFTSVASATAIVATQPVWAAIIARARGAYVAPGVWVGISIALVGVVLLTGVDVAVDPRSLVGDALALVGGFLSAAYVTAGERVRRTVSTPTYTSLAYGVSALALVPVCLAFGASLGGYSAADWVKIVALTAGAQLLGHTLINRVLRTTSATVTSLAILFEVPGAILIAALWLGQVPPVAIVPALVLLVVGLVIVIRAGDRRVPSETPPV